ncbi:two-component regulator propeller domain-containing protein [Pedobacter sp. L105]|uniref:ligand-binding sensor domain-containing protein n=1 Tax=Pedobacter sp. L105 TaxID=1641871 RepID=UPI00131BBDD5|nr:sensor histidine kinase [Pedobacter sp. L105]
MFRIHLKILFCCILLLPLTGSAQSYYFKQYQTEDGLAHNTVISMIQDRNGFMWIGTKEGLNRFDGYTFKSFKDHHTRFGSIGNNVIASLCEDNNGMIWVGTNHGMFRFDPYSETFTPLSIAPSFISNILVDKKGRLWFLSNSNLMSYDPAKHRLTDHHVLGSCIAFDPAMNLWLGTADGYIKRYAPAEKEINIVGDVHSTSREISKLLWISSNQALIGTVKQGLKSYDLQTGQVRSLLMRNKDHTEIYVRDIIPYDPHTYWIASESGIYTYNQQTDQLENIRKRIGDNYSLSDNAVYCLYQDHSGGLWAGTYFGGLNYLSRETVKFKKYYPVNVSNSISGNAVREICAGQNGHIWIGTEDAGINQLDLKNDQFSHYTSEGNSSSISYPNIHGLLAVADKLYIGPFKHGLEVMDTKTGRVIRKFSQVKAADGRASDFVMCIYLTSDNTLLIGTTGAGLFTIDQKKYTFKRVAQIPASSSVYALLEDHEGTIWTGSLQNGVYYYNPKTGKKGNIRFNASTHGLPAEDELVQGIYEDKRHFIWVTTEGGGLIRLHPDRHSFDRMTTENGLPSNNLFRTLEDQSGNLWISSLKGLICLNPQTKKLKVYTKENGLITDQFNYNSAFKDKDGRMFFGSVKGMISFKPEGLGHTIQTPPTYITDFQVNNTEVIPGGAHSPLKRSVIYTDTIVLQHDQSSFNIGFATLSYSSPGVTGYKYMMKGLDKDWNYLSTNRKAYFTNLSAGNYTFLVKSSSNVGNWNGKERVLFIQVLPPFWKSTLAYVIYLLLFCLSVYLLIQYYKGYLNKKNQARLQLFELEKEKEIYQAKIEFFTHIAHEIQTPLTLIIGPVERVLKKIEEVPLLRKSLLMIEKNANRLLELTTQLLDFRKTEMNEFGLSFVNTNINDLLHDQAETFRAEAEKKNIVLTLELPDEPIIAFVDAEAFIKITSNLISNAIKYGSSVIWIRMPAFTAGDKNFIISMSNDGKSIPKEFREKIFEPFFRISGHTQPGTGIGLSLARSLAELHNGSLNLVDDKTNLIIFELTLPVRQNFEFKLSKWKNINS